MWTETPSRFSHTAIVTKTWIQIPTLWPFTCAHTSTFFFNFVSFKQLYYLSFFWAPIALFSPLHNCSSACRWLAVESGRPLHHQGGSSPVCCVFPPFVIPFPIHHSLHSPSTSCLIISRHHPWKQKILGLNPEPVGYMWREFATSFITRIET